MKTNLLGNLKLGSLCFMCVCFVISSCKNPNNDYDDLMKKAHQLTVKNNQIDTSAYDKVLVLLDSAIAIIPQRTEAYSLKNGLLIAKKKYDKAIINNYRLISQYPNNPLYRMNYGYILKFKGDSMASQKEFNKALFLNQHALSKSKEENDKLSLALQRVELLHALKRNSESEKLFNSVKDGFKLNENIQNLNYAEYISKLE
ncbi:MAG TPA: hypothetical protein VGF79_03825 [Bacteroidia bacterium]